MNYYPYYNGFPYMTAPIAKAGGIKSLFKGIKLSSIINGTQKTLGVVNQALPLIKQARPVINNARTMFKVMNEFKKADISIEQFNSSKEQYTTEKQSNTSREKILQNNHSKNNEKIIRKNEINSPTFFQ